MDSSGVFEIKKTDGFRVIDDICFMHDPYSYTVKNQTFSFLVGNSTPYFGHIYDMIPKPIKNTATKLDSAVSISLSSDATKAISIHKNAGIAYWDITKNKIIDYITVPRQLKLVAYAEDDNSFYAFDEANVLFKYSFKNKISSGLQEMELYRFPANVTQVDNQLGQSLFISTDSAIYIFVPGNNIINQFYQAMRDQKPRFFINKREDMTEIYVIDGAYCKIFKLESVVSVGSVREFCFEATITNVCFVACNLACATLTNGSLVLFNRAFKIVQKYQNPNLADLIKRSSIMVGQRDQVFFINKRGLVEMTFYDWKRLLQEYFEKKLYIECFSTAITIYAGTAIDYFGVSNTPNIRCIQVIDAMTPLLNNALAMDLDEEVTGWIFTTANAFGMRDFIFITALNYYEKENKLYFFFQQIFGRQGSVFLPQAPPKLITKFAQVFNDAGKIEECHNYLSSVDFTPEAAKTVIDIAREYKMYELFLKMSVNVYHNIIEPCNFYMENGLLKEFLDTVLIHENVLGIDNKLLGGLIYWMFAPVSGSFERLHTILKIDWQNCTMIISKVLSIVPVFLANGICITQECIVDSVLRVVCKEDYDIVEHILELCFPLVVSSRQTIPPPVIKIAMQWIFNSNGWSEHRMNLLKLAADQYPEYIKLEQLKPYIEGAGFKTLLNETANNHETNIHVLSMNRENATELFDYFYKNYEKDKSNEGLIRAFENHIQAFIIADPEKSVTVINEYVPQLHKNISTLCNSFCEWLYLSSMVGSKYEILMTQNDRTRYFALMCKYCPEKVIHYLDETPDINLEAALEACLQNNVLKGSIKIYALQSETQKAIELMANENERILIDLIQEEKDIILTSADRVAEEPLLREALDNIKLAIQTAEKAPNAKDIVVNMWKTLFQSFQLPIWLSQNKSSANTKQAIALFFAYFIVEALGRANIEMIFSLLRQEFRALDALQYRYIFSFLIGYLGYRYNLSQNVESIYKADCKRMRQVAEYTRTRGIIIDNLTCGMCKQPIDGSGGVGIKCYECGHAFHNNATCGSDPICPVCKGEKNDPISNQKKNKFDRGASVRVRKLQRVDHGMKSPPRKGSHDEITAYSRTSAQYFQNEYAETNTTNAQLQKHRNALPGAIPVTPQL